VRRSITPAEAIPEKAHVARIAVASNAWKARLLSDPFIIPPF
jgi:hypothetical protein